MNTNCSQLHDLISRGEIVNVPAALEERTMLSVQVSITTQSGTLIFNTSSIFSTPDFQKRLCNSWPLRIRLHFPRLAKKLLKSKILPKQRETTDVHRWTMTNPSTKFRVTELKTPPVETIVAVEDVAEVLLEGHLADVEVTMVTMATMATAMANRKGTTNSRMVQNQRAGGVTSTDTVKKTAANVSRQTCRAKALMGQPIGQNKRPHQLEKKNNNRKFKEQLVKCTQANSQQCSQVFIEGRSYFPELYPKNIFFNDYDLVFYASAENKFIVKENYVLQWGIL
jgi:hypothetical protein